MAKKDTSKKAATEKSRRAAKGESGRHSLKLHTAKHKTLYVHDTAGELGCLSSASSTQRSYSQFALPPRRQPGQLSNAAKAPSTCTPKSAPVAAPSRTRLTARNPVRASKRQPMPPAVQDIPNLAAMSAAFDHMYRSMTGALEKGEQPAEYASVFQKLPPHVAIQASTPIMPGPLSTSFNSTVLNCMHSEELAQQMLIAQCGSLEEGKRQLDEALATADFITSLPDSQDPTIQRVELPGQTFHMRFWMGYQKIYISFDFCDNESQAPIAKPKDLTVWELVGVLGGRAIQLQSQEHCLGLDQHTGHDSFAVQEGTELEFRFSAVPIKRMCLPMRSKPAQPMRASVALLQ